MHCISRCGGNSNPRAANCGMHIIPLQRAQRCTECTGRRKTNLLGGPSWWRLNRWHLESLRHPGRRRHRRLLIEGACQPEVLLPLCLGALGRRLHHIHARDFHRVERSEAACVLDLSFNPTDATVCASPEPGEPHKNKHNAAGRRAQIVKRFCGGRSRVKNSNLHNSNSNWCPRAYLPTDFANLRFC